MMLRFFASYFCSVSLVLVLVGGSSATDLAPVKPDEMI